MSLPLCPICKCEKSALKTAIKLWDRVASLIVGRSSEMEGGLDR